MYVTWYSWHLLSVKACLKPSKLTQGNIVACFLVINIVILYSMFYIVWALFPFLTSPCGFDKKYCVVWEWNMFIWFKHAAPNSGANRWLQAGPWAESCVSNLPWAVQSASGKIFQGWRAVPSLLWMSRGWGEEINFHQEIFSHWESCWDCPW